MDRGVYLTSIIGMVGPIYIASIILKDRGEFIASIFDMVRGIYITSITGMEKKAL
jgi:hypothetical protein